MKSISIITLCLAATCAAQDMVTSNAVPPQMETPVAATNAVPTETPLPRLPFKFSNVLFKEPEQPKPVSEALNALTAKLNGENPATTATVREFLIASVSEGQAWHGKTVLHNILLKKTAESNWAEPATLNEVLFSASCAELLELFRDCDIPTEKWNWFFESEDRVRLIASTVTDDDCGKGLSQVIQKLCEHDPDDRDRFFNLILAMAVVWDTPRVRMDDQISEGWLPPDEDICLYYDYFKKLFCSAKAKVQYDELSVDSLVFVVDIPAPVSELEWALKNVDGTRASWGDHYQDIVYDETRYLLNQYNWPHREYTLQEIQECFGICVDQAYYSVLTARAHGIPCLFFHGRGKYGGHAWFGFMQKKDKWEMDVGRYSKQGYATGFAIHPQTDKEMTDHELEYVCSQTLQPDVSHRTFALARLAELLYKDDFAQGALIAAKNARQLNPLCESAWNTECDILADTQRTEAAVALLKEQAAFFKKYPDLAAATRKRQAALLNQAGNIAEANKLLGMEVANVATKRDDLQQELVMAQAEQLLSQGKARKGMDVIERILIEQRGNGVKLYPLILEYKSYAKRAGLSDDAASFLRNY